MDCIRAPNNICPGGKTGRTVGAEIWCAVAVMQLLVLRALLVTVKLAVTDKLPFQPLSNGFPTADPTADPNGCGGRHLSDARMHCFPKFVAALSP